MSFPPVAAGPPQLPWAGGYPAGQHQRWAAQHRQSVLLPVLGLIGLAIPGLLILGFVTTDIGPAAVLVGTFAAVLPVIPVVAAFLWVDRWEPEPARLLLVAFLWGACVATFVSSIVNDTASVIGDAILGRGIGSFVSAVISAPLVEEGLKGLLLLGLLWLRKREFNGVVDGIVYAGLVAAGFAFTENILYFGRAFATDGLVGEGGGVVAVFILRGLFSPFAHPLFSAVMGIAVGAATWVRSAVVRVLLPAVGYLGAALLHAIWNASAGIGQGVGFVVVYVLIMVPLFAGMIVLVVWQRHREQRVVAAQLPGFAAAGLIAPSEVGLLASLAGRRGWRSAVRRRAGDEAARAVKDYQDVVTELAFLRDRMARGAVGPDAARWHHELVGAVMAARARAVRSPEALGAAWRRQPPGWTPPPVVLPSTPVGGLPLPQPPPPAHHGPPPGYRPPHGPVPPPGYRPPHGPVPPPGPPPSPPPPW